MRHGCPYCRSYNTYIDLPGDPESNFRLFDDADGRMLEDTQIPLKCRDCGYSWPVVVQGEKRIDRADECELEKQRKD